MMPSAPLGPVAWVCLLVGLLGCVPQVNRWLTRLLFRSSPRAYVALVTTLSFALSVGYVRAYLGGGPRIIDATSYLLQAKVFATGQFTFEPPSALHSFAGRFLVTTPQGHLAVLFPPGFAALLALGVSVGAPMLVNPLVGALLALLTYRLTTNWFSEQSGRVAGVLSALCACLRYHSADTMSHAWAATLVLGVLISVTSKHHAWLRTALAAGACAGWLFATRPLTGSLFGFAGLGLAFWCAAAPELKWRRALGYAVGAIPGLLLWWTYQWVTTDSPWSTTQTAYYAQSDWPFGCFRLGLGANIGCRFEHGDFLDRYQPHGFGLLEAVQVTMRRLWQHQRDITNVPWLSLCLAGAVSLASPMRQRAATLGVLVIAHIIGYAFFYFDGNYPGGGARLFVDILPLEHVLLGVAFTQLRVERFVPWACLLGFAFWGASEHQALATREGGKPMFEAQVVRDASASNPLVFVSTDHGFNLGFEPEAQAEFSTGFRVARLRGDGFDFATWVSFGKPVAFKYRFEPNATGPARVTLEPFEPANTGTFVGRSFWPAATTGGATIPVHNPDGLRLLPRPHQTLEATLELPISQDNQYELRIELETSDPSTLEAVGWANSSPLRSDNTRILTFGPRFLQAGKTALALRSSSEITLLRITLVPAAGSWQGPGRNP